MNLHDKIRVVHYGIGVIGCGAVRFASSKSRLEIVGAIDLCNTGKDLGDIAEVGRKLGVTISANAEDVLLKSKPDVVVHTTSSSLEKVYPELEQIVKAGVNIVSSCEELSYPYDTLPQLAKAIDEHAKTHEVSVLATGVNPGFLMDAWPLFMTGVCKRVDKVKVERIQDASKRRIPFQKKIGAGKSIDEFNDLVKKRIIRHVGLSESVAMVAAGLGWELDKITESIEPVVCDGQTKNAYITVEPGQAAGVRQIGSGWKKGRIVIDLLFEASVGAKESYDSVCIKGEPDMDVIIKGGTNGDIATIAILINAIPQVINARPGLLTMKDLVISAMP